MVLNAISLFKIEWNEKGLCLMHNFLLATRPWPQLDTWKNVKKWSIRVRSPCRRFHLWPSAINCTSRSVAPCGRRRSMIKEELERPAGAFIRLIGSRSRRERVSGASSPKWPRSPCLSPPASSSPSERQVWGREWVARTALSPSHVVQATSRVAV